MMLQMKFDYNQPAGLWDIHVWKCGRTDRRRLESHTISSQWAWWAKNLDVQLAEVSENILKFKIKQNVYKNYLSISLNTCSECSKEPMFNLCLICATWSLPLLFSHNKKKAFSWNGSEVHIRLVFNNTKPTQRKEHQPQQSLSGT